VKMIIRNHSNNSDLHRSRYGTNWNSMVSKCFWRWGSSLLYTTYRSIDFSWRHEQSCWENGIQSSYKYPMGFNGL